MEIWLPEQKDQINVTANLDLPLTDDVVLYSFSSYGHRKTIGENFYEPPTTKTVLNQSSYFKERYPDGRSPLSLVTVDDFATTVGVKKESRSQVNMIFMQPMDKIKSAQNKAMALIQVTGQILLQTMTWAKIFFTIKYRARL